MPDPSLREPRLNLFITTVGIDLHAVILSTGESGKSKYGTPLDKSASAR